MKETTADIFFWLFMVTPWVIAIIYPAYFVYAFWPNIISALFRIFPISLLILVGTNIWAAYETQKLNGMSGPYLFWLMSCGIPYGFICGASLLAFIIINIFTGMTVWLGA